MNLTEAIANPVNETQGKRKPSLFRLSRIKDAEIPYDSKPLGDTPDKIAEFFRNAIAPNFPYNPEVENFVVILLNTRRKIEGYFYISTGTLDTLLVHPREVFRGAIIANAQAIICCHNHPSGDPMPSEADIRVTRELIRAGQLLKIELLDHIIIGEKEKKCSLRELGYFYS